MLPFFCNSHFKNLPTPTEGPYANIAPEGLPPLNLKGAGLDLMVAMLQMVPQCRVTARCKIIVSMACKA